LICGAEKKKREGCGEEGKVNYSKLVYCLASHEQAATTLNDSNAVSCTVPVFAGNEAVLFPGIRERIMTGIPRRPGNGSPGMHSLPGKPLVDL